MAAAELANRRIGVYGAHVNVLPLQRLRIVDLVHATHGMVGVRGKRKDDAVAAIRRYLLQAPATDALRDATLRSLDQFRVMQDFASSRMASDTLSPPAPAPAPRMQAAPASWLSAPAAAPASGAASSGARFLGVPPPRPPALPRPSLDAQASTYSQAIRARAPATSTIRLLGAASAAAEVGGALRSAARKCVPHDNAVMDFAFGPALAPSPFSVRLAQAVPTYDQYGRASRQILVVSVLAAGAASGPLFRVPAGARIELDSKTVRVPTPTTCAWDITRMTVRGRRASPVTLSLAYKEPGARVLVAVARVVGRAELSAPVLAIKRGLAHPGAALCALRAALTGSYWRLCNTSATEGASLRFGEAARQRLAAARPSASAKDMWEGEALRPSRAGSAAADGGEDGDDDEIGPVASAETIRVADPVTLRPVRLPVRGVSCRHLSVFDARTFEALVAVPGAAGARKCPHCRQPLGRQDLRVDTALAAILAEVRTGRRSGDVAATVAAAFCRQAAGAPAGADAPLAAIRVRGVGGDAGAEPTVTMPPGFLNTEEGVAVEGGVVSGLQLHPSGQWQAVGHGGAALPDEHGAGAGGGALKRAREEAGEGAPPPAAGPSAAKRAALASAAEFAGGSPSPAVVMSPERPRPAGGGGGGDDSEDVIVLD